MIEFRNYSESDRDALFEITSDAWSVFGPGSEMHVGDLAWALLHAGEKALSRIWLAFEGDNLAGYAFLTSPRWCDFVLRPSLTAPTREIIVEGFVRWADEAESSIPARGESSRLLRFGRRVADSTLSEQFESLGFRRMATGFPTLIRPATVGGLPSSKRLLDGFSISEAGIMADDSRCAAWNSAFPNEALPTSFYSDLRKMKEIWPSLDLSVSDSNGGVASFLTVWRDAATSSALFEPVGCHADFRRTGLTRILMEEACRQLSQLSVAQVFVRVSSANRSAHCFYEACGFVVASQEFGFERPL